MPSLMPYGIYVLTGTGAHQEIGWEQTHLDLGEHPPAGGAEGLCEHRVAFKL